MREGLEILAESGIEGESDATRQNERNQAGSQELVGNPWEGRPHVSDKAHRARRVGLAMADEAKGAVDGDHVVAGAAS